MSTENDDLEEDRVCDEELILKRVLYIGAFLCFGYFTLTGDDPYALMVFKAGLACLGGVAYLAKKGGRERKVLRGVFWFIGAIALHMFLNRLPSWDKAAEPLRFFAISAISLFCSMK